MLAKFCRVAQVRWRLRAHVAAKSYTFGNAHRGLSGAGKFYQPLQRLPSLLFSGRRVRRSPESRSSYMNYAAFPTPTKS